MTTLTTITPGGPGDFGLFGPESTRVLARLLHQLPAAWRTGPHHRAAMERLRS